MNTFGNIFRLTSFGESHGPAIGGVIDGMPAGVRIDLEALDRAMKRRRPGQSEITTTRNESDSVEILSGLLDGVTTGTSIGFIIRNNDQHSSDYEPLRHLFRPSHADYTYTAKYGLRDHRGGGRASARETASRIVAGEFARQALLHEDITITAFTSAIGPIQIDDPEEIPSAEAIESNIIRCPEPAAAQKMIDLLKEVRAEGDTIGGTVGCIISGVPAGLGDPVFGKLQAKLAEAIFSIPAVKAFEYGMGFAGCRRRGSEMIDPFSVDSNGSIHTLSNHSGGIQGGISNGEDIRFRVGFKPVATLLRDVTTVDDQFAPTTLKARGRHDPCVVPRAVPIVEAMAAMVIFDAYLLNRTSRI